MTSDGEIYSQASFGGDAAAKAEFVREMVDVMRAHPERFDVCVCGDYRHQHENGEGACRLKELCTPYPCPKFRLARACELP